MKTRFSRGAITCALLTSTALATPAFSQSAPARRIANVDANGVDVIQGSFVLNFPEGSIGSGQAELALVRRSAAGADNFDQMSLVRYDNGGGGYIYQAREGAKITFTDPTRSQFVGVTNLRHFNGGQSNCDLLLTQVARTSQTMAGAR